MLLSKGLIRIEQTLRADAEFDVIAVDDPYGYATTSRFSFFRRPLPSTNLKHAAEGAVMWDGRETDVDDRSLPQLDPAGIGLPQLIGDIFNPEPVFNVLARQADNATLGHAQAAAPLTEEQKASIVNFELALFSAQSVAKGAGSLTAAGGNGGPVALSQQPFIYLDNTSGLVPFDSNVFTIYNAWKTANNPHRKSIARGQEIFNNKKGPGIQLPGFNPNVTCSECHSARNIGDVSAGAVQPFPLVSAAEFRTPDMPLYTLRCNALGAARGACTEGQTTQSTDPGRGTVSGRWADINVFKAPALRALATRAPYFHNGSAATLDDVIDRYVQVLGFTFTQQERTDLINFLNSL
jgi:cytochrome c peroxidase